MNKLMLTAVCCLSLCVTLAGCGGRGYSGDRRFPLSGTVTFDGEPVDVGSISLLPTGGGGRASGGVIQNGKYVIPEEKGVPAGTYRVELSWLKKTGRELKDPDSGEMYDERVEALPEKYHKNTEIQAEIPAPENTVNFDLKSA